MPKLANWPKLKKGDSFIFTEDMNGDHIMNDGISWHECIGKTLRITWVDSYSYATDIGSNHYRFDTIDRHLKNRITEYYA